MNHPILSFFLTMAAVASLSAADLKLGLDNWYGNPLAWKETPNGFQTVTSGGGLRYTPAPLSENCEISAVVTVKSRTGEQYATAGVGLWYDSNNHYHLALVESPIAANRRHFIELHQRFKGAWPGNDNLQEIDNRVIDENWKYDTPYLLKISKTKSIVTGTVTAPNGEVIFQRTWQFRDDSPVNFVRPFLSTSAMVVDYKNIQGEWSGNVMQDDVQDTFPPYNCNSFIPDMHDKATGFFHVKKDDDGRWWAYDPLGRGFVVFGIDHVSYWGHWCEFINRHLHKEFNDKRFKNKDEWEVETLDRLTSWGFNMLMGGDGALRQRGMAHAIVINVGDTMATFGDEFDLTPNKSAPCTAFPNVFHPKFRKWCEYRINLVCKSQANNPWLFGYFIDNELCWWGHGSNYGGLFDTVMKKSADHTAKLALRDFLAKKANNDVAAFNKVWETSIKEFDDILKLDKLPNATDEQKAIKTDFLRLIAEIYFGTVHDELRKVDPNHMLLGCRFAGIDGSHPVVWETAGKYSDVLTWNYYGSVDLDAEAAYTPRIDEKRLPLLDDFKRVYEWTNRPCLITEWSFPALDSGLPCTYGAGQRFKTQAERAKATEIFARTMLSMPFLIGYDYFMWVDQPPLGISHAFPENSNYGIINLEGKPYEGLVKLFTDIQHHAKEARLAPIPAPKYDKPLAEHGLYDQYLDMSKRPAALKKTVFDFTQNPKPQFSVDAGRFHIYTNEKETFLQIDFDGQQIGNFGALLHYENDKGGLLWNDINKMSRLTLIQEKDCTRLEIISDYIPRADAADKKSFKIEYALVIPKDADWMLAQFKKVHNLSDIPINIRGIFLRFFARFDGKMEVSTERDRQIAPRVWKAPKFDGWLAPGNQRYFAFAAGSFDDITIHPWYDENRGSYHPDLVRFFPDPIALPPNGAYQPDVPFYFAAFAGKGNLGDAQKHAIRIWK